MLVALEQSHCNLTTPLTQDDVFGEMDDPDADEDADGNVRHKAYVRFDWLELVEAAHIDLNS